MEKTEITSLKVTTQTSSGEAFFILEGSPSKPNRAIGSTKGENTVDPLLQFELKFDSLRTYLEGFTTVINQHATIINNLQSEIQTRLIESNLYGVIQQLGSSSAIKDKPTASILNPLLQAPRAENTGKKHEDVVNGFCNKLELFTHGFAYFNKMNATFQERFEKIETQLKKKVDTDEFKAKVKKTKKKLNAKIDENYKVLDEKISALDVKVQHNLDALDRKIDEVEKQTIWKIRDCQVLLESRINNTYVDDSIRMLEERLRSEIDKVSLGSTESFQNSVKDLTSRIKKCEDQIDEKTSSLKKNIKELEVSITKKHDISKFEEFKKEILARIDGESDKLRLLSRKCEPAVDRLLVDINKVNEDITQIRIQIQNMNVEIENLALSATKVHTEVITTTNTATVVAAPTQGINKEELDTYFSKYRIEINKLKETVRILEETVHTKVDSSHFSMQIVKKLDISEFEKYIASTQGDAEKMKRLLQNSEALQNKMDKIEEMIEKKLAKLKKDLDIANLIKQLKAKAEEENVIKGFENTDKKINALSENILALKKELDQALSSLEKISMQMMSTYTDTASLSTKKINPLACLSCGHVAKPSGLHHTMMGSDGKLYKADVGQELMEGGSAEVRSSTNKSLISYTYSQGVVSSAKTRPQTANSRAKFFKNNGTAYQTVTAQVDTTYLIRPGSAKK